MSKYDQNIKEFLLNAKEVSFEKIGVFSLTRPAGNEKVMQTLAIDFWFNKKAQTSDELIDFIVKETGKNKTLVSSDLTSLFEDARQYVNIGKTYSIAGLGSLFLNRAGEYEFTTAQGSMHSSEAASSNTFAKGGEKPVKKQARKNAVIFAAFLIILLITAGLGWGVYKYMSQQKNETLLTAEPDNTGDSTAVRQKKIGDSVNTMTDLQPPARDSINCKFIFQTFLNGYRANNRFDTLKSWGEHVFIDSVKTDSLTFYHLFTKARLAPKDTAYARDSVQKYFKRPVKTVLY